MSSGGYRPGGGRPRGASPSAKEPNGVRVAVEARKAGRTPLDYMLAVMNDEGADDARRDRMAIAAAPFVHEKPSDRATGKKEAAQEAAKTAGQGSEWGDDLSGAVVALN